MVAMAVVAIATFALQSITNSNIVQIAIEEGEICKLILKPWKIGVVDFESLVRRAIDQYYLQLKRYLEECLHNLLQIKKSLL